MFQMRVEYDPFAVILEDTRLRLQTERCDGKEDPEAVRQAILASLGSYERTAERDGLPDLADPTDMFRRVFDTVVSYGPLTHLLTDPEIEEILIEGDDVLYIDRTGALKGDTTPSVGDEIEKAVRRLLKRSTSHRDLNDTSPIVCCGVLDGTARLIAVQTPVVKNGLSVSIRKQVWKHVTLPILLEAGSLSREAAGFLWTVMRVRSSLLISGQPGAGKTSLLAALLDAEPPEHVLRCCEEVQELPHARHAAGYYEAQDRPGQRLRDLVRLVLGMRPYRIVIGEVKGEEAYELTRAANAGCGFCCTIHANSASDALEALVSAALMAGENVAEAHLRRVFGRTIQFVVHLDMAMTDEGIQRRVMEIAYVQSDLNGSGFVLQPLFTRDTLSSPLVWKGVEPPDPVLLALLNRELASLDLTVHDVLVGRGSPL